MGVGNFRPNFLSHFFFNFENLNAQSLIYQNTLNFTILDEFEGSYGRFSTKGHFFWDTLYIKYVNVNRCIATGCKNACLEREISIKIVD